MAFPVPLALGAAALAALLLLKKDGSQSGPQPNQQPGPQPGQQPGQQPSGIPGYLPPVPNPMPGPYPEPSGDNVMPPALRTALEGLLANGKDPAAMEVVADELDRYGFHMEANLLRLRAAELRDVRPSPQPAPPPPAPAPSPAPTPPSPQPAPAPTPAAVYTASIIAPSGLRLRTGPDERNPSQQTTPYGTKVKVLETGFPATPEAPKGWAKIQVPSGLQGYSSVEWLHFDAPAPPTVSGVVLGKAEGPARFAKCLAPSGCRLRHAPKATSPHKTVIPHGATVRLIQAIPGPKSEHRSPGPGGWSRVLYNGHLDGWIPSEWLVIH